jgi:hypothetical protein
MICINIGTVGTLGSCYEVTLAKDRQELTMWQGASQHPAERGTVVSLVHLEKMLATYVHPLAESGRQLHLASWDDAYSQPLPEVGE